MEARARRPDDAPVKSQIKCTAMRLTGVFEPSGAAVEVSNTRGLDSRSSRMGGVAEESALTTTPSELSRNNASPLKSRRKLLGCKGA